MNILQLLTLSSIARGCNLSSALMLTTWVVTLKCTDENITLARLARFQIMQFLIVDHVMHCTVSQAM